MAINNKNNNNNNNINSDTRGEWTVNMVSCLVSHISISIVSNPSN
jgi:hypothetical protein